MRATGTVSATGLLPCGRVGQATGTSGRPTPLTQP